ncbi:MAG: Restriction alleviation protein Lar [Firmicutes bacterium]|nr:Restriction alleviation protein Lar [Bacillota bacterium]
MGNRLKQLGGVKVNIKPCPFCGSTNTKIANALRQHETYGSYREEFKVFCNTCESSSGYCSSNRAAIKKWNQRPEFEEATRNTKTN